MSGASPILDWTAGTPGIAYQRCVACEHSWYFRRGFCPRCGTVSPDDRQASGSGTVYAVTLVARAPSDELRAYAPYLILLVDADEGFRVMAHGDPSLAIGDRVRCKFITLTGKLVPSFEKAHA